MDYVSAETLKTYAEANESSSDAIWEQLASAVSRLFDKTAEVAENFFAAAPENASSKTFRTNGTEFLRLAPYISGSIASLSVDGETVALDEDLFYEEDNYLVFDKNYYQENLKAVISARWGFAAIPDDVIYACAEQALFMWRRKDLAFTELSGVSTAAVQQQFSPTFTAVTQKYREMYGRNFYAV